MPQETALGSVALESTLITATARWVPCSSEAVCLSGRRATDGDLPGCPRHTLMQGNLQRFIKDPDVSVPFLQSPSCMDASQWVGIGLVTEEVGR